MTAYAESRGVWASNSYDSCYWWLRSPGYRVNYASLIHTYGGVLNDGYNVNRYPFVGLRTVMWIDVNE